MIFQRAIRRELGGVAGAVFTALFTITITVMLIKILGQAAGGKVASSDVILLIGLAALKYLPIILILTGFVSVLLVVARSCQDMEMVVWFASGLSLSKWVRPVLTFALPWVFCTALLSFVLTPWANRVGAEVTERFEKREDVALIAPGKFRESSSANRIFFVEGKSGDAMKVQNVFVNTWQNGHINVIVAKQGFTEINADGDKFLVMQKGRRYESLPGQSGQSDPPTQPDFQMMDFERYAVLLARPALALVGDKSAHSLSTQALLANPNKLNQAELLWRISLPLMCLMLMLFAIPLGFVHPRVGRSMNLIIALLLYISYSNITSILQVSVTQGRLSFAWACWPIHFIMLGMTVTLFLWRINIHDRYHPVMLWKSFRRVCFFKQSKRLQRCDLSKRSKRSTQSGIAAP